MPRLVLSVAVVIAAVTLPVAVYQSLAAGELRGEMAEQQQQFRQMQAHIDQLESNLQSAGLQMSNLAAIAQEATERAARCEADTGSDVVTESERD